MPTSSDLEVEKHIVKRSGLSNMKLKSSSALELDE